MNRPDILTSVTVFGEAFNKTKTLLLLFPIVSTSAFAQIDSIGITNKVSDSTHKHLEEVIVNSNGAYVASKPSESLRLNMDLSEVSQNISVTTSQTIKDMGLRSAAEIFRTAAGVQSYNTAGQDVMVMMRGTTSQNSILYNGIGAGYYWNQEADAAMIDKVEFVSGPAGFMTSNADPGGLINIVTKQPTHQRIFNLDMGLGSWNMMRAALDIGGEIKKNSPFTYRLNIGVHNQQQPYQFGYLKKYFAAAAIKYELNSNTDFTLEYNISNGHSLNGQQYLPTVSGRFFVVSNDINIADPNVDGLRTMDNYFRGSFNYKINNSCSVYAQLGAVYGHWNADNLSLNTDAPVTNDTIYRNVYKDRYNNRLYAATAFLKGTFNTGKHVNHQLLAGLDFGSTLANDEFYPQYGQHLPLDYKNPSYYVTKDSLQYDSSNPDPYTAGNYYSALYVQDHIEFYDKFIVTLAARYTLCTTFYNYQSTALSLSKLTPRLGVTYLFNKDLSAYAVMDEAFVPQTGKIFGGENFGPLTGNNKEIGFKSLWFGRKLSANVALYYTIRNNVLTADPDHPGFQVQTGQITSKGVELNMIGQVSNNISITANYNYSDAHITKSTDKTKPIGLYNFNSPVHNIVNVYVKYRINQGDFKGLSFGFGIQHLDKFNASRNSNDFVAGNTLLQASSGYSLGKFYVNLNVYNLTNAKYVTYASKYSDVDYRYTPGQPINFRLNFGYQL